METPELRAQQVCRPDPCGRVRLCRFHIIAPATGNICSSCHACASPSQANYIISTFIREGAPKQLNLDASQRDQVGMRAHNNICTVRMEKACVACVYLGLFTR